MKPDSISAEPLPPRDWQPSWNRGPNGPSNEPWRKVDQRNPRFRRIEVSLCLNAVRRHIPAPSPAPLDQLVYHAAVAIVGIVRFINVPPNAEEPVQVQISIRSEV